MNMDVIAQVARAAADIGITKRAFNLRSFAGTAKRMAAPLFSRPGAMSGAASHVPLNIAGSMANQAAKRVPSLGRSAATAGGGLFLGGHALNAGRNMATNATEAMGYGDPMQRFQQHNQAYNQQLQEMQNRQSQALHQGKFDQAEQLSDQVGQNNFGRPWYALGGLNPFAGGGAAEHAGQMESAQNRMNSRFSSAMGTYNDEQGKLQQRMEMINQRMSTPGIHPMQRQMLQQEQQSLQQRLAQSPDAANEIKQRMMSGGMLDPTQSTASPPGAAGVGLGGGGMPSSPTGTPGGMSGNYWNLSPEDFRVR